MKLPHRRKFLHLASGAAVLPALSRVARGQAYPTRPVRLIVGLAAGSGVDVLARLMGQWLLALMLHQIPVENRFRPLQKSGGPKCCDAQYGLKLYAGRRCCPRARLIDRWTLWSIDRSPNRLSLPRTEKPIMMPFPAIVLEASMRVGTWLFACSRTSSLCAGIQEILPGAGVVSCPASRPGGSSLNSRRLRRLQFQPTPRRHLGSLGQADLV
jgi:hypothetical protein